MLCIFCSIVSSPIILYFSFTIRLFVLTQLVPLKIASKCEAQYVFTEACIATVASLVQQTGAARVLCVGVPSVHEAVSSEEPQDTMLLDIDARYVSRRRESQFVKFHTQGGTVCKSQFMCLLSN